MDPFERGVDKGRQRDNEERERYEKFQRLAAEAIERVSQKVKNKFLESGYEFRVSESHIHIVAPSKNEPERELEISAYPDERGVPYFSSLRLEWYCDVKKGEKLSESKIIEYLGEFYGKTIAEVAANKARITADAVADQKYLAAKQRESNAAEAAEYFKKVLKWIAIGVVVLLVISALR